MRMKSKENNNFFFHFHLTDHEDDRPVLKNTLMNFAFHAVRLMYARDKKYKSPHPNRNISSLYLAKNAIVVTYSCGALSLSLSLFILPHCAVIIHSLVIIYRDSFVPLHHQHTLIVIFCKTL